MASAVTGEDQGADQVLAVERDHLSRSREFLRLMREDVLSLPALAGDRVSQEYLKADLHRRAESLRDLPDTPLFFGRLDYADGPGGSGQPPGTTAIPEQAEERFYIGRRHVHDQAGHPVVIDWRAPVSRPFYRASQAEPMGLALRRRFGFNRGQLTAYEDEVFTQAGQLVSVTDGYPAVQPTSRILIEEIERPRSGSMRDIVATIQPEQDDIVRAAATESVCVQGAPGTGKTAVGLHRASWLLYTQRETLQHRGVLVVGPNRTFMEYVSHVLPALGEDAVEQRAVGELVDGVEPELRDPPALARLKADVRLVDVIARAAELRLQSEPEELVLRLEGSFISVREREVRELLETARARLGTTLAARERFRMNLLRRFYSEYGRVLGGAAFRNFDEIEQALRANGYLDRVLKAAWPVVSPDKLVRSLTGSRGALAAAADGILTDAEQKLLVRRRAVWSDGDVPLLDEARALLGTPPRSYGHVIVDEAQDLTPMQLRMIARRAREGSLTLLGDVAQATGAVRYPRWDDVLPHLPHGDEADVEELRHAYRVPREIMEVALPLLDTIAPDVAAPISYRTGAEPPAVHRVEEEHLLAEAYRHAAAAPDGLLAVIVPEDLLDDLPADDLWNGVPVLTPRQAKGLEFDHVVVVEPALIELRELYVALTRPTKTLVVVHARDLPVELLPRS